jgi:hypothetical protein
MGALPRNVRSRTPRTLQQGPQSWCTDTRRVARFVVRSTPTPPPVAVSIGPRPLPAPAPPAPRRSFRALLTMLLVVGLGTAVAWRTLRRAAAIVIEQGLAAAAVLPAAEEPAPVAEPTTEAAAEPSPSPWKIRHEGHESIHGGVLVFPKTFLAAEDGRYDLVIHFHGDVAIVRESVEHAGIDAALAIINVGIRSQPYREAFQAGGAFERLLAEVQAGVAARGVKTPQLGRIALVSWSAGYGAVESVLENRESLPAERDPLDAIICLDGIHGGFVDGDPTRLDKTSLRTFVRAAQAAADGRILFSMTHSEIDPKVFASSKRSQMYLLDAIGAKPYTSALLPLPPNLELAAAARAVAEGKAQRLVPTSDTHVGLLRVQGFKGELAEHHAAHLTQMAAIALPDLAKRWEK